MSYQVDSKSLLDQLKNGRIDSNQIFEQVKENQRKLQSCSLPHDFEDPDPETFSVRRYRCTKCGGELDRVMVYWYNRGLDHGRKVK